MTEHILIGISSLLVLGIGAQWLAWKLRLPSILLLLVFGFLAGPITGLIRPDELMGDLLFPFVSVAVAIILFEGGLTLRLADLPQVGRAMFRLISLGALATWMVAALGAHYIVGLSWSLSALVGAILIVTGPTVITPLLRQVKPKGQVGTLLKWEGILIDPVGAILAVLVFEVILEGEFDNAPSLVLVGGLETLVIGIGISILAVGAMILLLRQRLIPDYLQNGVSLLFVVVAFTASNLLQEESGLLTVTLMGIFLANQNWVIIHHIAEFKENLQVLLIGTLFILLAARLQPAAILALGWQGLLFVVFLIVVGRPLAVFLSTLRSPFTWQERLFTAWVAPRGIVAAAVSSVFAFELVEAGMAAADQLVSLTFLVIVGTVSFYGLTAGPLARRLGLAEEDPQGVLMVGAHRIARAIGQTLQDYGFPVLLVDTNYGNVQQSRMQGVGAFYGNVLAEDVRQELNLSGIGRLLAMTSNDDVNSLATLNYSEVFGRSEVYQLPTEGGNGRRGETPQHLRGRLLFAESMTHMRLTELFRKGAVIKATKITEKFNYRDFQLKHGNEAVPMFLITERNKLDIYTTDNQPTPKVGQTLISVVMTADDTVVTQAQEMKLDEADHRPVEQLAKIESELAE